jgi:uncharacterized protein (TIGR02271 family)
MTIQTEEIAQLVGQTLVGSDGDKIGTIDEIYLDDNTGQPQWLAVSTGLFGSNVSFVPLEGAQRQGDEVRVQWDKQTVKDAPNATPDGHLQPDEERRLYQHYSLDFGDYDYHRETAGHDTSGPNTDEAMTRSEEELKVGTAKQEAGRARLRKYVVTEQVQTTVPVQREEVRIEREPITDGNVDQALDGPAISEEEHEVVLHEEVPVVQKQAVPKERVRMEKDTHVEEETVTDEVRKEQIDVDGDSGNLR